MWTIFVRKILLRGRDWFYVLYSYKCKLRENMHTIKHLSEGYSIKCMVEASSSYHHPPSHHFPEQSSHNHQNFILPTFDHYCHTWPLLSNSPQQRLKGSLSSWNSKDKVLSRSIRVRQLMWHYDRSPAVHQSVLLPDCLSVRTTTNFSTYKNRNILIVGK